MEEETNGRAQWKFLIGAADEIEAGIIETLLRSSQIPVLKKYREAGAILQIFMGMTSFGIDLYVPANCLEQAEELLQGQHL